MTLFDSTTATDDDAGTDTADTVETDTNRLADTPDPDGNAGGWNRDELPIEFVLSTPSRFELTMHAVRSVSADTPLREHNKSELAEAADVSRHAVHEHIDVLATLGIYDQLGGAISRYRANPDSVILGALVTLNDKIKNRTTRL